MLRKLHIDNYALIENSLVDLKDGFTVITGETGAGKSIMLDALSLLTGARADSKAIGNKERKTVVEAVFEQPDSKLKNLLEESGLEWDEEEIILRREMSPSGKSRGFINDTPVNLSLLSDVSKELIDIHSQHSNSLLTQPHQQLAIIDAFGNNDIILEEYRLAFKNYVTLRNRIKNIKDSIVKGKENEDFIRFRLEQLDKIKPKSGELVRLEREAEILGDADRLNSKLKEALEYLSGGNSAIKFLQGASSSIEGIDFELLDPDNSENLKERLNSLKIEMRDISDTLEEYAERINSDPERLEKVQKRINLLYEAMKRFKVKDEEELVVLHNKLKKDLEGLTSEDADLGKLDKELKEKAKELKEKADILSEKRNETASRFSSVLIKKIAPLGLPNLKFTVEIEKGKLGPDGQDKVAFYCSFNKNHPMQPVSDIASGGEISRVMLGIKSVMAENMKLPTVVFDEIDTGVSGEIAFLMGKMMKQMSSSMQVLTVTHLPQVAAQGDTHLKVYKADDSNKTVSHIRFLDNQERENEIAGMLSGTEINDVALQNARLLLKNE